MVDDTISIKNMSKIHQLYLCPGSFHQTRICNNPSRSLGIRLTVLQDTDPNPSHVRPSRPYMNAKRINNLHVWPGRAHMRESGGIELASEFDDMEVSMDMIRNILV
ncbi:hypothetical protein YC2023_086515 [Brassica napus]